MEQDVECEFIKQRMDIMKNPQALEELFALYLASHYDGALLKRNFVVNTEMAKLKDALLEKDEREGYGDGTQLTHQ